MDEAGVVSPRTRMDIDWENLDVRQSFSPSEVTYPLALNASHSQGRLEVTRSLRTPGGNDDGGCPLNIRARLTEARF